MQFFNPTILHIYANVFLEEKKTRRQLLYIFAQK